MASKSDIINLALIALGNEPLMSLADTSRSGRFANAMYDIKRKAMLQEHVWKCARQLVILSSPLAAVPLYTWTAAFQLPADFIRLVQLECLGTKFLIQGNVILSMDATVNLDYVYDLKTEGLMDPLFVDAFSSRLAFELALPLTGDNQKKDSMWKEYQAKINKAKFVNAIQSAHDRFETSGWLNSRYYGDYIDQPPGAIVI